MMLLKIDFVVITLDRGCQEAVTATKIVSKGRINVQATMTWWCNQLVKDSERRLLWVNYQHKRATDDRFAYCWLA